MPDYLPTIIIGGIVIGLMVLVIVLGIRARIKGKPPSCSCGGCSGCASNGLCHPVKTDDKKKK